MLRLKVMTLERMHTVAPAATITRKIPHVTMMTSTLRMLL